MRAKHSAFLRKGSTVRATATCFDKHDEPRFSESRFGDLWETSFMIGRVRRVLRATCMVQWDDAEVREVSFEHFNFTGTASGMPRLGPGLKKRLIWRIVVVV